MEKMMKKPEVEAVRFDDADVIATSGPLKNGYFYSTLGSELNQQGGYGDRTGGDMYKGKYNSESNGFEYVDPDDGDDGTYAWYNKNGGYWATEGKTTGDYYNNEYPTGYDN